jgi:hypothetical protein
LRIRRTDAIEGINGVGADIAIFIVQGGLQRRYGCRRYWPQARQGERAGEADLTIGVL